MGSLNEHYSKLDQKYYLPTFRRFPIALERGEGCYVWDVDGKKYLDTLAGIAVNALGHCHPAIVKTIEEQAQTLLHVSNFFVNKPQVALSEKLTHLSGLDHVFITNSGAESLEGAFKIARKYAHSMGRGGNIISFENSFHGRTLATIASGKKKYQQGFEPMPSGFSQAKFNDLESVKALVTDDTAAIVIEPIQGEGGINVADKQFLKDLRTFCTEHKIVLIFDEVQSGIGRTGHWFAKDHFGIQPDIMTLAKGLGGGVPIGAILSNASISSAIDYGDHGTTFGGNPLVCAVALTTIKVIEEQGLLHKVQETSAWLKQKLQQIDSDDIVEVRGVGLMLGVEFNFEIKSVILEMLEHGVIANVAAERVLRIVPPLIITKEELGEYIDVLQSSLNKHKIHA
jgi:acetylornithine/N-succinyldiaminopimelate aminotransferase